MLEVGWGVVQNFLGVGCSGWQRRTGSFTHDARRGLLTQLGPDEIFGLRRVVARMEPPSKRARLELTEANYDGRLLPFVFFALSITMIT